MADESSHTTPLEHNIDYHIITLFERLEALRKDSHGAGATSNHFSSKLQVKRSMRVELRTLEFWRSIISECLASFFYVFIVCGAAAGAGVGASVSSVLLATSLASGLAMATLTQCFLHISGAHINPAVTLASCVIRVISPIRAAMYVTAQCGGGIAGAALLYSITVPGYQGNLQAAIAQSASLASWERFGIEFILTFIVVLSYFVSTDSLKKFMGNSAISIGVAYSACSFVSMPYLNPARSFGPSFVLNRWDHHWVYWFGPVVGGICSGIIYEYIFNPRYKSRHGKASTDNDSSSIHSEDDLNYDLDMDKTNAHNKYAGTLPRNGQLTANIQNFYSAQPHLGKLEAFEPVYDGARSMYSRTPTLPRANLSRSQSVYAKANAGINREIIPRPGPLIPVQTTFPIRAPQGQMQNQNLQNQMQQGVENFYTIRGTSRQAQQQHHQQQQQQQQQQQHNQQQQQQHHQQQQQQHAANAHQANQQNFQAIFATRQTSTPNEVTYKYERRPELMYGLTVQRTRGHSTQSDDSSYGSYLSSAITPPARLAANEPLLTYTPPQQPQAGHTINSTSPIRHQAERKVTLSVAATQQQQQQQQQPPPPPPAFAGEEAYTTNQESNTNPPTQSAL